MFVQFYEDFTNFIEEASIGYLPENVILCDSFNLPNIRQTSEPFNYVALQYICPRVISAVDSLLYLGLIMDWHQQFLPHSKKGFLLDLLFGSASVCLQVPTISDRLVAGVSDHHEFSFSKVCGLGTSPSDSESKNKPLKNFAKANFDVINAELDLD